MLSGEMQEDEIVHAFEELTLDTITVDHLVGAAQAMRAAMVPVALSGSPIDTCGTGGSGLKTINTSTLVAFIVAAAGGQVAKHGNRSASGNCGCFDLLEALGAVIELTPEQEQEIYNELGIVFLFAKTHHPAMRFVGPARKAFGQKTIFNLLGPLANPAGVQRQMIGTGNHNHAELMIAALEALGAEDALVVTGEDGLDEISICAETSIRSLHEDQAHIFSPEYFSISLCNSAEITGGTAEENTNLFRAIASGSDESAHTHLVLVNAAYALLLTDLVDELQDAYQLARQTLASGAVAKLIGQYVQASQDVS